MLSNAADAEDALQDTFIRYMKKRPEFKEPEHEKAWFIKVATNVCRDMRRFNNKHSTLNIEALSDYYHSQEQGYVLEPNTCLASEI